MNAPDLPARDADGGDRLVRRLDDRGAGPAVALWLWNESAEAWVFVAAGGDLPDDVDQAQAVLVDGLEAIGAPWGADRLEVKALDDPLLAALGRRVQVGGLSRVGLRTNDVDGVVLPPALVYRLQLPGQEPGMQAARPRGDAADRVAARRRRRVERDAVRDRQAAARRADRDAARARRAAARRRI